MPAGIVLLSSGLDSTINLACALEQMDVKRVLTFDYGQRAAIAEIRQSQKICLRYKVDHQVIELPWLKAITNSALVNRAVAVPVGQQVQIDDYNQSLVTAKAVWVPNRNGIFLNIAASFAEAFAADFVIPGFNIEEAQTFPDNSKDFLAALEKSFSFSTASHVKTKCFTTDMNKTQIVKLGRDLAAPFDLMWPCYFSAESICRECESCLRFLRAKREL